MSKFPDLVLALFPLPFESKQSQTGDTLMARCGQHDGDVSMMSEHSIKT